MKTSTLLRAVLFLSIIVFAVSCKKDHASSPTTPAGYYVKIKKNGTWTEYATTAGELGPDLGNSALTDLGVSAQNADGSERFELTIQVSGTNFNTGDYISDNSSYQTVLDIYQLAGSNLTDYEIADAPNAAASKYTVTISAITSTEITGTFTGNYLYADGANTSLNVTEGEFHVKRVR